MEHSFRACPLFGVCGGCGLRDRSYPDQLLLKQQAADAALAHVCASPLKNIIPSGRLEFYRNRMDFVFGWKDDGVAIGLRQKGKFNRVVDIGECFLFSELGNEALRFSREYFTAAGIPVYNMKSHQGVLRYLVLREGKNTGEFMVNVVTAKTDAGHVERYADGLARAVKGITTIVWSVNDSWSDVSSGAIARVLLGPGSISETLNGMAYRISPYSFFQTNTHGAELLYRFVRQLLEARLNTACPAKLYDLYSGSGGFGQYLADLFTEVIGVESQASCSADALDTAAANKVHNYRCVNAPVEEHIGSIAFTAADVILADPPRQGMHKNAVKAIIGSGVKTFVYVSCNIKSLAADLEALGEAFVVRELQPLDLFPHTPHMECVALLERK